MKYASKMNDQERDNQKDLNLFQVSPHAILQLDHSYCIVDINSSAEKLIGLKDTLLNQPIEVLCFDQRDQERLQDHCQNQVGDRVDIHIKSRAFVPVHVTMYIIQSNDGFYCFIEQLQESKNIKRELIYYKKALDALDDGAILFDQDGLIFYANPVAQKNLAKEHNNIIGMNIKQLWAQKADCPDPLWWDQLTSGHSYTGSLSIPPVTQNESKFNIYINPLSSKQPNTLGFVCLQKRTLA